MNAGSCHMPTLMHGSGSDAFGASGTIVSSFFATFSSASPVRIHAWRMGKRTEQFFILTQVMR
jgi:hypothetical protein